jgi:hypothetical protein
VDGGEEHNNPPGRSGLFARSRTQGRKHSTRPIAISSEREKAAYPPAAHLVFYGLVVALPLMLTLSIVSKGGLVDHHGRIRNISELEPRELEGNCAFSIGTFW